MRPSRLAAPAALLLAGLPFPAAHAAPDPVGATCTGVDDSDSFSGTMTWEVWAGPLVLVDPAVPGTTLRGSVHCTFRVGNTHAGATLIDAGSHQMTAVVVLTPTQLNFSAQDPNFSLCTSVHLADGRVLYRDEAGRAWTTDPNTVCTVSLLT